MNKIIKNALILAAITLIPAGLLLGAAHQVTLEAESRNSRRKKNRNPARTYSRRQLPLKK